MRSSGAVQLWLVVLFGFVAAANVAFIFYRMHSIDKLAIDAPAPVRCPPPQREPAQPTAPTRNCDNACKDGAAPKYTRQRESKLRDECDADSGWGLVDAIRQRRIDVCPGEKQGAKTASKGLIEGTSRITCYPHRGGYSRAPESSYVDMENVALVGERIEAGKISGWAGEDGHLSYGKGALVARPCKGGKDRLKAAPFAPQYEGLMKSLDLENEKAADNVRCDAWVDETVVAVTRNEWAHLLFSASEALNAFTGAHVVGGVNMSSLRVLLLDTHPLGPFGGFYGALSQGGAVMSARDILLEPKRRTVCFRRLIVSLPGYSSWLVDQATGQGTRCRSSPLLRDLRNRILEHHGALDILPNTIKPSVAFVARRPYQHEGFNKKKIGRVVTNEKDLSAAMAKHASTVSFEVVDLATLSLAEQLKKVRTTSVLVGMHGAGLVHSMFLPDDAVLLEIWPHGYGENMRDRNIAVQSGHVYLSYELESASQETVTLDVKQFLENVDRAVHIVRGSYGEVAARCGFLHC